MTNHPNRSKVKDWASWLACLYPFMTQSELADKLMVPVSDVLKWESGEVIPPPYLKLALLYIRDSI